MSASAWERPSLLPGDWVEVRAATEIAAALGADGATGGLPFMPEMLPACGRRFRVGLRAERVCTSPPRPPFREVQDAVVLGGLRCDGAAHGGCQLGCMFLWHERWLRRVEGPGGPRAAPAEAPALPLPLHPDADPARWTCQATQLNGPASRPGPPLWRPSQYLRLVRTRTFTPGELVGMFGRPVLRRVARKLGLAPRANGSGAGASGLRPGDWVRVRSAGEIRATLGANGTHRGLSFGGDMMAHCGRVTRVAARVERIIDERNGRLREVRDTVTLEDAFCARYLGCARQMPILWREAWLERAAPPRGA